MRHLLFAFAALAVGGCDTTDSGALIGAALDGFQRGFNGPGYNGTSGPPPASFGKQSPWVKAHSGPSQGYDAGLPVGWRQCNYRTAANAPEFSVNIQSVSCPFSVWLNLQTQQVYVCPNIGACNAPDGSRY